MKNLRNCFVGGRNLFSRVAWVHFINIAYMFYKRCDGGGKKVSKSDGIDAFFFSSLFVCIWSTLLARYLVDCISFTMAFLYLYICFSRLSSSSSLSSKTMFQIFVFLITVLFFITRRACVSLSWIFGIECYRISSQFVYWIKCLSLSLSLCSQLKGATISTGCFCLWPPPESNNNRRNVVIKFTFKKLSIQELVESRKLTWTHTRLSFPLL